MKCTFNMNNFRNNITELKTLLNELSQRVKHSLRVPLHNVQVSTISISAAESSFYTIFYNMVTLSNHCTMSDMKPTFQASYMLR